MGRRKGNIFAVLFGGVVLVGLLGAVAFNFILGPTTTMTKVTAHNLAQNDLLMNAKVVVMNASTRPNMGDEDGDGYIEPVPFVPVTHHSCHVTLPAGSSGGCLPTDIGAIQTDPWGTQYMYCVWDHGDPASSTNRITGEDSTSGAVLAIISAGPNKRFETPCRAYDGDPATNDDAINPDGIGDDLVQIFTYAAAVAGSGGLWELKQNDGSTATTAMNLEVGDVAANKAFTFDASTGTGVFPYVRTDFLSSRSGTSTPVTMLSNIALDGKWLSGNGSDRGVFVDNSGNVGIGTNVISDNLHVKTLQNNRGLTVEAAGASSPTVTWYRSDGNGTRYWQARTTGNYEWLLEALSDDRSSATPAIVVRRLANAQISAVNFPNGRVGIGTTAPANTLHVDGVIRANDRFISRPAIANNSTDRALFIGVLSDEVNANHTWGHGDVAIGLGGGENSGENTLRILGDGGRRLHTQIYNGNLTVRIGSLGVGTTTPESKLHVTGYPIIETNWAFDSLRFKNNKTVYENTDHTWHIYPQGNTTNYGLNESYFRIGIRNEASGLPTSLFSLKHDGNLGLGAANPTQKLHVVGNVLANQYLHPSDERLKTNIETANGLDTILNLRGVTFDWKESGKKSAGIIAQDVEKIMPHAVTSDADGMKSVEYDQLVAPLIEAIKELHAKVTLLEESQGRCTGDE